MKSVVNMDLCAVWEGLKIDQIVLLKKCIECYSGTASKTRISFSFCLSVAWFVEVSPFLFSLQNDEIGSLPTSVSPVILVVVLDLPTIF